LFTLDACGGENITKDGAGNNNVPTEDESPPQFYTVDEFVMGADLSYVNQVLDHGGVYRDSGLVKDPYRIFSGHGANVVRLRLWHNPKWIQDAYGTSSSQLYSDLHDVEKSIRRAREQGMAVAIDYHYSDFWADPDRQEIPEAWREINDIQVLQDSVYQYTKKTLMYLNEKGLMPEMVQIGNEINCGMLFSDAPSDFPPLNVCNGHWKNLCEVINRAIRAVREVSESSDIETKIILHVAQPENVEWWFDNVTTAGEINDFDIVGFSYYSLWSNVPLGEISTYVSNFRQSYGKEVMMMETAYPWTLANADTYANIFGSAGLIPGYPATPEGQRNYLIDLTQEMITGSGKGVFYWEPGWITSDLKDLWGTGSSWENNAFFDFDGNVLPAFSFMTYPYDFGK